MVNKKFKWIFHKNPDPAMPHPDKILTFPDTIIKQNPVRSVHKAADPANGDVFYIKYDEPRSTLNKLRNLIYSKSRQEFNSSMFLYDMNIPVIRYEAVGEYHSKSCLISREIKDYCSAAEFWYSQNDHAMQQSFITALTALLKLLNKNRILHPDFHLGNLMCDPNAPGKLLLPDPYGVRKVWCRDVTKYNSRIITNLAAEINADKGREILCAANADPDLWDKLLLKNKNVVNAQWPRRMRQILTGNSKFSRTEVIDGVEYQIRNSRWYAPVAFTPEQYRQVVMPSEKAMECWLESFKKELLYDIQGHPKALRIMEKESILFYDEIH